MKSSCSSNLVDDEENETYIEALLNESGSDVTLTVSL